MGELQLVGQHTGVVQKGNRAEWRNGGEHWEFRSGEEVALSSWATASMREARGRERQGEIPAGLRVARKGGKGRNGGGAGPDRTAGRGLAKGAGLL